MNPSKSWRGYALALCACLATVAAQAANLIGIYNNTSAMQPGALRIQLRGETNDVPVSAIAPRFVDAHRLPLDVDITQGAQRWTLRLEAPEATGGCTGHRTQVKARVLEMPGIRDAEHSACVNESVSRFLADRKVYSWQNVVLAIADNPEYDPNGQGARRLPFRFGLSAWTSNRDPWNRAFVREAAGEPRVPLAGQGGEGLRVLQGHPAWGGGIIPRLGHAHVTHLYNDTPYLLLVARSARGSALSEFDFTQFVPPFSAAPFAMAWVPRGEGGQGSAVHVVALAVPPAPGELPPDPAQFEPIAHAAGGALAPTPASIEALLAQARTNTPSWTDRLMGRSSIDELVSNKYTQYFRSRYAWRLQTGGDSLLRAWHCRLDTEECTAGGGGLPATEGQFPHYFRLVATASAGKDVALSLAPIGDEDVFEH